MFTMEPAVRSLKFTRSGLQLIAGNEVGVLVVFDIVSGQALDVVQTCQARAVWQIDVSHDDAIVALGTEMGTIELYSLKMMTRIADQKKRSG
jgi:hypothetical protein